MNPIFISPAVKDASFHCLHGQRYGNARRNQGLAQGQTEMHLPLAGFGLGWHPGERNGF